MERLGINSETPDKGKNFESGEGWEFSFDTDVHLQNIDLREMSSAGTLTISSASFADIVITGERNGVNDLSQTLLPAKTVMSIGFTDKGESDAKGPRIISLSVSR